VTVLPSAQTGINICTAPAQVLESLSENLNGELGNAAALAAGRKTGCFPDLKTFKNIIGTKAWELLPANTVVTTSNYFRLTTRVSLGTSEFTLYSLLYKTPATKVTPLLRSFGTT
jgi:type II secretory pathway component PulK